MRIPRKIKIGHHVVKVKFLKECVDEKGKPADGMASPEKNEILIQKGLQKNRRAEVFLHEALHIISGIYDVGLSERQVVLLANFIISLIKTNKLDFTK